MNRFATFAVLVLAVSSIHGASVDQSLDDTESMTQFKLQVTDDEEVAQVEASGLGIFSDFCTSSRDYILGDIKTKAGEMSSLGFSTFFQMAEDVAKQALSVNEEATSKLSHQLANPDAQVDGDDTVAEAQRQISGQSQPMALVTAFKAAFSSTTTAIQTVVNQKLATLKTAVSLNNWIQLAESGCAQASSYEAELEKRFDEYKQAFESNPEAMSRFGNLKMDAIPCVTSGRLVRINGICSFIKVSIVPTKKILAPYFNSQSVKDATAERY